MLKKLRSNRGWSQQQLAEMTGLSRRTICRIENGGHASNESLKALAAVFEVDFMTFRGQLMNTQLATDNYALAQQADNDHLNTSASTKAIPISSQPSCAKQQMLHKIRVTKKFYLSIISYAAILIILGVVNLLTSTYPWVLWVALGLALALLRQTIKIFSNKFIFTSDWERQQMAKQKRIVKNREQGKGN